MENIQISISRNDLGQLLDGLEVLIDQWQATANYLTTGVIEDHDTCIRECHKPEEAQAIAQTYRHIADQLMQQKTQNS